MSRNIHDERGQAKWNKPQRRLLAVQNVRLARRHWEVSAEQVTALRALTEELQLSIAAGDLMLLDSKWYVTHAGLLHIAHRTHCTGIRVHQVHEFCDPSVGRWVFK